MCFEILFLLFGNLIMLEGVGFKIVDYLGNLGVFCLCDLLLILFVFGVDCVVKVLVC